MLSQYQKNRLENIQKKCLKTIYGTNKTYKELLEEAELQTLEERRKKLIGKFAIKAAANPQFEHWFPKNKNRSSQRSGNIYQELHAKSDRLYYSPLYTMRRMLNNTENQKRHTNPNYTDLSSLFNVP